MEEIDKDQINTWSDSECAKKGTKRDRRTECACKAANLESGHLSIETRRKRGRELCRFLRTVGPGKAKIRCKCLEWECTCYVHGMRRKPACVEWDVGAGAVAQGSPITEGL